MIKVNTTNAVSKEKLYSLGEKITSISKEADKFKLQGSDFLGWKNLAKKFDYDTLKPINAKYRQLLKLGVDTLVVIGIGGSFAGAKAAIDMIQGEYPTNRKMEIVFIGESISSTNLAQKIEYVSKKNFAINVISKSGTTTEPAVAFRLLRTVLENKVGSGTANKFIVATTDANKGSLLELAKRKKYKTFVIPDNVGGRFSVITPVGLFPIACAGINIKKLMEGVQEASIALAKHSVRTNPAYQYAAARFILSRKYNVELMVQYEPQMKGFSEWWKQLTGESEGKNQKGLFPASAVFTTDLHSLGQFVQDGSKTLFETVITVKQPMLDLKIPLDNDNLDKLNYLTDTSVHKINEKAFLATTEAHVNVGKVPNIHIEIPNFKEKTFGYLAYFFMKSTMMTAYLLGVNPFNQPGVEVYKQNMFKLLGKTKD